MLAEPMDDAQKGPLTVINSDTRYTDTANAERLIAQHGKHLRYVGQWGWLVYYGTRWQIDERWQVMEKAKETVRTMRLEAAAITDSARRKALWEHANRSESQRALRAMVDLAKSDPTISATVADFDSDPWLFNVKNGTLDLRTGELRTHDPADLITKLAPVGYYPDARSEVWDNFVRNITGGQDDLARYLQGATGYSLTGDTREKVFFFLYGPGNTGKSTLMEAVGHMLGDYGTSVQPATIMTYGRGNETGGIPNDLAALVGVRYALTREPEAGQRFKMGLVKSLTGNDTISARFLQKEWFNFKPQLKTLAGCQLPARSLGDQRCGVGPNEAHSL